MSQKPSIPTALDQLMTTLAQRIQSVLDEQFLALYLQGSYGLGSGDAHSDVDFLVVIAEPLSADQLVALKREHNALYDTAPGYSDHLEGSYFPLAIVQDKSRWYTPVWYLDNGAKEFERSPHDNEANVFWVTRNHGITTYGADAITYIPEVTAADLTDNVHRTMHSWGKLILDGEWVIDNMWAQPFTVMSWCRMLHTLEAHAVHSKYEGVQWGLNNLDARWHDLIAQSWQDRPDPMKQLGNQPTPEQIKQTIDFVRYALTFIEGTS